MSSLPDDIFHDILIRLPVKQLLVCRSVCKNWYALISNPNFVNAHLSLTTNRNYFILTHDLWYTHCIAHSIGYQSLNNNADGAVDMLCKVGSIGFFELLCVCNGLVCLNFRDYKAIVLWNPATREYRELPQPPTSQDVRNPLSALGYVYKINDYKLVIIIELDERTSQTLVYTLGSNSWKKNQNISCGGRIDRQSGVFVNGSFHWLARNTEDHSEFILSFDVSNERFNDIQLPRESLDEGYCCICVGVLEGHLCLFDFDRVNYGVSSRASQATIWVMQEYGVRESWSKRYVINHQRILKHWCDLRIMWCFKNGEILFDFPGRGTIIYDPEHGSVREANVHGLQNIIYEQGSYFETLVSLNSGMYVGENGRVELSVFRDWIFRSKQKDEEEDETEESEDNQG